MSSDKNWHQNYRQIVQKGVENRAFIGGDFCQIDNTRTNYSALDGSAVAEVSSCGAQDADAAVKFARKSFESGEWSQLAPVKRKRILQRWGQLILQHAEELALLETIDTGKPISNAIDEAKATANTLLWNAEAIDKVYGEIAPTAKDCLALVQRLPLGVIAAIVPWNFPLTTTAWKLGPSLAAGNSVILKPASSTPLSALKLAELAQQAGLPKGALQVLPGSGAELGQALSLHMDIDGLTFTGSTQVGKQLMQDSGKSNLKRTFLELGGKSPHIVCADADLDKAAAMAACAIFYNTGQTCTAGSRLLVEQSIYDTFVKKIIACSQNWLPGDPLDPKTAMGPLIDAKQFQTVQQYVAIALDEGASIATGGVGEVAHGSHIYQPTILTGVHNEMRVAREEIFGPVLAVIPFKDTEQAIEIANNSIYGLAGAVWSRSLDRAHSIANRVRVGTIGINNYFGGDITVPFGGFKQSGNGRDKSLHAFNDYTELKTTWIEFDSSV